MIDLVIKLFTIQNVSIKILVAQALNQSWNYNEAIWFEWHLKEAWIAFITLLIYLKNCWFFAPFDLQNTSFMWFKFTVLLGNLHRLSWAMTAGSIIGQVPMYQKGCELRCLLPRVRQAQIHANQSCMLTDVSLVERFSVHCRITPGGQLTILM